MHQQALPSKRGQISSFNVNNPSLGSGNVTVSKSKARKIRRNNKKMLKAQEDASRRGQFTPSIAIPDYTFFFAPDGHFAFQKANINSMMHPTFPNKNGGDGKRRWIHRKNVGEQAANSVGIARKQAAHQLSSYKQAKINKAQKAQIKQLQQQLRQHQQQLRKMAPNLNQTATQANVHFNGGQKLNSNDQPPANVNTRWFYSSKDNAIIANIDSSNGPTGGAILGSNADQPKHSRITFP